MTFRPLLALSAAFFLIAPVSTAPAPAMAKTPSIETPAVEVWKSPSCNCCSKWADYLKANGFAVTEKNTTRGMLQRIKRQAGIGKKLASCHTARIGGYTIEGHVPADDIKRLLAERPDAIGLTVPDMPLGSPGMEQPDGKTEPYDVLLVKKDGSTEIFAKH